MDERGESYNVDQLGCCLRITANSSAWAWCCSISCSAPASPEAAQNGAQFQIKKTSKIKMINNEYRHKSSAKLAEANKANTLWEAY